MGFPPQVASIDLPEVPALVRANAQANHALVGVYGPKPHSPQDVYVVELDLNLKPRVLGHRSAGGEVEQAASD